VSERVNIETDILARHVEKLLAGEKDTDTAGQPTGAAGGIDMDMLSRHGFIK